MFKNPSLAIYRGFWLSGVLALIAVGAPYWGKPGTAMPLTANGRESSMDSVLENALGAPDQASRIAEYLAQLPLERPIAVLLPANEVPAAYVACSVSYLSWPRPAQLIWNPTQSRATVEDLRARYCAIAWCYLPPPPDSTGAKTFGIALTIERSKANPK